MLQATVCDGNAFDALSFFEDLFGSAKVDVGWCDIVDALVVAGVTSPGVAARSVSPANRRLPASRNSFDQP